MIRYYIIAIFTIMLSTEFMCFADEYDFDKLQELGERSVIKQDLQGSKNESMDSLQRQHRQWRDEENAKLNATKALSEKAQHERSLAKYKLHPVIGEWYGCGYSECRSQGVECGNGQNHFIKEYLNKDSKNTFICIKSNATLFYSFDDAARDCCK